MDETEKWVALLDARNDEIARLKAEVARLKDGALLVPDRLRATYDSTVIWRYHTEGCTFDDDGEIASSFCEACHTPWPCEPARRAEALLVWAHDTTLARPRLNAELPENATYPER